MKRTFLFPLLLVLGCFPACDPATPTGIQSAEQPTVSDPSEAAIPGSYGAELAEMTLLTLSQMEEEVSKNGVFNGQVQGQIDEVCTSKGCWLTVNLPSGKSMRVTFKDYGFFVPTQSAGYPLILEGVATMTETDVATLRHFASDAGKSTEEIAAITEPEISLTFEATGVSIKAKS